MARKYIDCREYPSEVNCTVAITADSEAELLEAAAQHAVAVHQHTDGPELRQALSQLVRDGTPPENVGSASRTGAGGAQTHTH